MLHYLCNSFFTICWAHTFILCYYYNMLSGIVLEIACAETLQRSGCFDSHINLIYLAGCVLFSSLHGAHIRSYFVEAREKVTALQGDHSFFAVKLWRSVASSLVSTKCRQWKHIVSLSCHSDFFFDFGQVCDHYNSFILSVIIEYRSVPGW